MERQVPDTDMNHQKPGLQRAKAKGTRVAVCLGEVSAKRNTFLSTRKSRKDKKAQAPSAQSQPVRAQWPKSLSQRFPFRGLKFYPRKTDDRLQVRESGFVLLHRIGASKVFDTEPASTLF